MEDVLERCRVFKTTNRQGTKKILNEMERVPIKLWQRFLQHLRKPERILQDG